MATIDELRGKFEQMTLAQKKQFIGNLRTQLQNSTNAANKQFLNECIKAYNEELQGKTGKAASQTDSTIVNANKEAVGKDLRKSATQTSEAQNSDDAQIASETQASSVASGIVGLIVIILGVWMIFNFFGIGSSIGINGKIEKAVHTYIESNLYRRYGETGVSIKSQVLSKDRGASGYYSEILVVAEYGSPDGPSNAVLVACRGSRTSSFYVTKHIDPVLGDRTMKEVLKNKDANIRHAKLTWGWEQ